MKLFEPLLLQWWQIGLFKAGLLAAGVAAGAYWHMIFAPHIGTLLIAAAGCLAYVGYIRLRQE